MSEDFYHIKVQMHHTIKSLRVVIKVTKFEGKVFPSIYSALVIYADTVIF